MQACNFIKKETLAQAFFYEFCEISQISQFLLLFQSLIIFEKISTLYFWLDCECPSENHLSAISDFTEYVLTLDLKYSLREKYLNAEIFLDRIWTLSTQWFVTSKYYSEKCDYFQVIICDGVQLTDLLFFSKIWAIFQDISLHSCQNCLHTDFYCAFKDHLLLHIKQLVKQIPYSVSSDNQVSFDLG